MYTPYTLTRCTCSASAGTQTNTTTQNSNIINVSNDVADTNNQPSQNVNDTHSNKGVSFSLQNETTEFLPIPKQGLPFFRRARGCFSAEARANTRAAHLDSLTDAGKPARWAFGIGNMPSYMAPLAA